MVPDRRQFKRFTIFLTAEFKTARDLDIRSMGVIGDFSQEGFSLECQQRDLTPGEKVECVFRDPRSALSIQAVGEIVWKGETWYKCVAGMKFCSIDQEARDNILKLISENRILSPRMINKNTA